MALHKQKLDTQGAPQGRYRRTCSDVSGSKTMRSAGPAPMLTIPKSFVPCQHEALMASPTNSMNNAYLGASLSVTQCFPQMIGARSVMGTHEMPRTLTILPAIPQFRRATNMSSLPLEYCSETLTHSIVAPVQTSAKVFHLGQQ